MKRFILAFIICTVSAIIAQDILNLDNITADDESYVITIDDQSGTIYSDYQISTNDVVWTRHYIQDWETGGEPFQIGMHPTGVVVWRRK
jgi:hypothetical protein